MAVRRVDRSTTPVDEGEEEEEAAEARILKLNFPEIINGLLHCTKNWEGAVKRDDVEFDIFLFLKIKKLGEFCGITKSSVDKVWCVGLKHHTHKFRSNTAFFPSMA